MSLDRRPTMADVAREAGVGVMTVSRVLRGDTGVSAKLTSQVRNAIDELGYISNNLAGGLSSRKSRAVVIAAPSFNEPNVSPVIDQISLKLGQRNYQVLLANTQYDMNTEISVVRQCLGWQPAGIILWGNEHSTTTRNLVRANGIAAVDVWNVPDEIIDCAVGFSHVAAARIITEHVLGKGARRPVFVRGAFSGVQSIVHRERGYREALNADARIEPWVFMPREGPLSIADGAAITQRILSEHAGIDALLFAGEAGAVGAVLACQKLGVSIPNDLMVAGFGDSQLMEMMMPSISTVTPSLNEIAELAVTRLIERMEDRALPGHTDYVHVELIARQSTTIRAHNQ